MTLAQVWAARLRETLTSAYSQILQTTPALVGEDQEKVRDYFGVVKTFAPNAAANPLVAGALVNKMVQFGGVDHKIIQDLVSIEGPTRNVLYDIASKAGQSLVAFPGGGAGGGGDASV